MKFEFCASFDADTICKQKAQKKTRYPDILRVFFFPQDLQVRPNILDLNSPQTCEVRPNLRGLQVLAGMLQVGGGRQTCR